MRATSLATFFLLNLLASTASYARTFCTVSSAIGADATKAMIVVYQDSGKAHTVVKYDDRTRAWTMPRIDPGMYRLVVSLDGHETQDVRAEIGTSGSVTEFVLGVSSTRYIFQGYYFRPYIYRPREVVIFSAEPDSQAAIYEHTTRLGLRFLGVCGDGRDMAGFGKLGRIYRFEHSDTIAGHDSQMLQELRAHWSTRICGPALFYDWNKENCTVYTNNIEVVVEGWVRDEDVEFIRVHPRVKSLQRDGNAFLVQLDDRVGEGAVHLANEWSKVKGIRGATLFAAAPLGL